MGEAAANEELGTKFKNMILELPLRIDLGFALGVEGARPTATFYTQGSSGRYSKADLPFLAAAPGCDRGDLLHLLGDLWREAAEVEEPSSLDVVEQRPVRLGQQVAGGGTVLEIWNRRPATDEEVEHLDAATSQAINDSREILGVIVDGHFEFEPGWAKHEWSAVELEHVAQVIRNHTTRAS